MIQFANEIHLEGIIDLWKKNRTTLGFMPKDAFKEHIRKKWILVGTNKLGNVEGYLQYRLTNRTQTISIVHLCVNEKNRGKNLARRLLDALVQRYEKEVVGIRLSCRSDYYQAIKLWQKYNFQPKGKRNGRGSDPNVHLITWWYSFGATDLFSAVNSDRITAVLDFNIIAKLRDILTYEQDGTDVEVLQSNWITEEVDYLITSETKSEIFRDTNNERNERSAKFIKNFKELNVNKSDVNKLEMQLRKVFHGQRINDRSDRRQIAETILSGTPYFITSDDGILTKDKFLEQEYGLKVFSPVTFAVAIDELKNQINYNPAKLSAENFSICKLGSGDYGKLEKFILGSAGRKKELKSKIQKVHAHSGELLLVKNLESSISIIGRYFLNDQLIIEILRVVSHPLAETVLMQNLFDIISYAAQKDISLISIQDRSIERFNTKIFNQFGFQKVNDHWFKALSNKILRPDELKSFLEPIFKIIPDLEANISKIEKKTNNEPWKYYFLEKKYWPLKIDCDDIPTYIIPIKPVYARALFDTKAARQTLFGVAPKLIWNNENVYYRSVTPSIETVPARILWYASSDKRSSRQKSIVATSYLDEIITGSATDLFTKFKKYGVYKWDEHITPLTNGNANKIIKVLKFSNSESFSHPIPYKQLIQILKDADQPHNNFVSPVKIKAKIFADIYKKAKGISNV